MNVSPVSRAWLAMLGLLALAAPAKALSIAQVYEDGQVLLYEGSKAGLKEGQILTIERSGSAVGQIQIDEVTSFTAKGRTLEGNLVEGDAVAKDAGVQDTELPPFQNAGRTPMLSQDDPNAISTGAMKRKDVEEAREAPEPEPEPEDSEVVALKPLEDSAIPLGSGLTEPQVVATMGEVAGLLENVTKKKPSAHGGSMGMVNRPSAVVFKPRGGMVGVKYGFNRAGGTRKVYQAKFAPTGKFEAFAEATSYEAGLDNLTRFGGKIVLKSLGNGSQIAGYGESSGNGGGEYGLVASFENLAGRFSIGGYLSNGGATKLVNRQRVKVGEDYGFYIGMERDLIMGLSAAVEYDTLAAKDGNGMAAELRWKRGSNYYLTAAVQDTDGWRDATIGALFSF